ncbi:MAG: TIGR01906 family membrane protein [Schleiferilactobacillus perolens]|jgi:integral membrane protein (TIGR01906 family)|uniref:TIGR01906 family membrane protein n=1 Tax=Schleiferilactobacillus perolens TaxID=100468 RepID=UPI0039ECDD73|nr:TIGR01906 family membrane protein [Schleiferilactobacillus harbinensis]MCI1912698.1 TIGR01906 family membrane protein [Schleiferilactobacillus harbinensis]
MIRRFGFWVALWLFVLSAAIAITILGTFILYPIDVHFLDILDQSNVQVTFGQLYANFAQLMAYLHFPWITTLHMTNFPVSSTGAQHFSDVKNLFLLDYAILIITAWPAWHFLGQLKKNRETWRLYRQSTVAMGVPIVLGALALMGFDRFFVTFHEILFRNSDWIFDPAKDPIITVLPEDFFAHTFFLAFILLELICWGLRHWAKKQFRA